MDRIEIRGLRVFGRHGVLPEEQETGQTFVVDLTLELDLDQPARSDALGDTVDYGALAGLVAQEVEQTRFDLIEALAGHLVKVVLASTGCDAVTVRVGKPQAPLPVAFADVGVVLRRERGAVA
jgi:dihydroneopterin aldolase